MTSSVDATRTKGPGRTGRAGGPGALAGSVPGAGADRAGGPVSPGALSEAMAVVAAFVSEFEPGRYSGEDATTLVSWFARTERLCVTGKALAATRAAEANAALAAGQPTPAHWLAGVTGESLGEAVGTLKLGESFSSHPGVEDACRRGELSRSRAALVAEAAQASPGSEDELVARAATDTFRQVKDRCARIKAQARSKEDAEAHDRALHRSRSVRTWTDRHGAFHLDARLTPVAGATLSASLTAEADAIFRAARRAGLRDSPDNYRADALVALVTGTGTDTSLPSDATGGEGDDLPRRPGPTGPKTMVTLRVDIEALRRGSLEDGEVCEIPGVGPVSLTEARRLLGDSLCNLVITKGVDIATVCHLGRSIPAHIRTALVERDRTCVVPGCDVAQGLEIDHWLIPFEDDGPASMANLVRICRFHHRQRHYQGFTLSGSPGAWLWDPPGPSFRPPPEDPDPETDEYRPRPLFTLEE